MYDASRGVFCVACLLFVFLQGAWSCLFWNMNLKGTPLFFSAPRVPLCKGMARKEEIEMSVYPNVNTTVEVPKGTPNGTLFVDVGKTYGVGICDPTTGMRVSLEDCARGYWKVQNLSQAHASRCNWLVARMKGRIKGVWKIDTKFGWKDSSLEAKPTWPSDQPFKQGDKRDICRVLPDDAETVELRAKLIDKPVHLGRCFNTLRGYFC